MKEHKINPEIAAHNIAIAITQSSISDSDKEILRCYISGNTPNINKLLEFYSKFNDIYNALYENSYNYFESK